MNWSLQGLGFNQFTMNHFRIFPKLNLGLCNILSNIFLQEHNVLSSAILLLSDFEVKQKHIAYENFQQQET